ncbi:MAG: 7-cyano-7-deazaguanine synthase, partial [Candidatus Thioglobus sp.]
MSRAVVLLSGGLDSTTTLAIAKSKGFECYALSFDYGQKQKSELISATKIAKQFDTVEHRIMHISLSDFGGSALTDENIEVPNFKESDEIP